MSVGGVIDAYEKKQVNHLTFIDLETHIPTDNIGLKGSPTRVKKSFPKTPKGKGIVHNVSEDEAVGIIVRTLKERVING
jgi:electron transfer flavoprotein beta subunit